MKKYKYLLLAAASGLLLAASWPENGFPFLIFVAFLPLFYIEEEYTRKKQSSSKIHILGYAYITFFIWNALTTYWILNSTIFGGVMAVVLNSLFMAIVFYVYHLSHRITKNPNGLFILIFYWLAWEYFHLDWDLSWPWLNLGNVFASYPEWIQWYEFTGTFGGTAWVLIVNILIFKASYSFLKKETFLRPAIANGVVALLFITIPLIISHSIYKNYSEEDDPVEITVVQPNLDPYSEQYNKSPKEILNHIFSLAEQKTDSTTQYIVCPESAIQERPLYEKHINRGKSIQLLKDYMRKHQDKAIVIGASTYYIFEEDEEIPLSARQFNDSKGYYNAYNTAIYLDTEMNMQLYHKSKLTPGVERMPFKSVFKHIENLAIDLGGTVGTLGTDSVRRPFKTFTGDKTGPAICYESVYGDFFAGFVRNGANFMLIITNDGWWGDTPGYKQHMAYASLRAIETRRSIARSANTGISGFINQRGEISKKTPYWEEAVINKSINKNDEITFYVRYGDYIGRIGVFGTVMLLLITIAAAITSRNRKIVG